MPMFDLEQLRHAVQLAIAPVFLLNAVAALLGAIAGRLARIIDRARVLEERLEDQLSRRPELDHDELRRLKTRGRLVNMSIALLVSCGVLIGLTVMALFVGETTGLHTMRWVPVSFMIGVLCFVLALLCFLVETLFATHILKFGHRLRGMQNP